MRTDRCEEVVKRVTASIEISWSIYDSWTELLTGTRMLLDFAEERNGKSIEDANLLRLVLISSHQMIEVMFFSQLETCVNNHPEVVKTLFQYDMLRRISFSDARGKWPAIVTGSVLDFSSEPLQSMKSLSTLRNAAIHHTATAPKTDVGESAFFTAIEASKAIYNHFNQGQWSASEYAKFVESNQAKSKILLRKALSE